MAIVLSIESRIDEQKCGQLIDCLHQVADIGKVLLKRIDIVCSSRIWDPSNAQSSCSPPEYSCSSICYPIDFYHCGIRIRYDTGFFAI